jgi:MFS family permease
LQTENTPLASKQVLNLEEVSWVGSVFLIGGTVSSVLFGWMAEKFGRKTTIIVAAVPQVASWAIIRFGTNVTHLVVARLLVGFAGGGCFVAIPMYVAEISSDK